MVGNHRILAVSLAAAALAAVGSLRAWQQQQQQPQDPESTNPRYEYVFLEEWRGDTVQLCYARAAGCEWRFVRLPFRDQLSASASATAQLGAQGWELVASHPYGGDSQILRLTFRRTIR